MAKKEQVAVRLPQAALDMIDELVGSIMGTNAGEVARELIIAQLRAMAAEGLVTWKVTRSDAGS